MNSPEAIMTSAKRIFLAGEGPNELGSWAKGPEYQDASYPGVLETLMIKVKDSGWKIMAARQWKSIRNDSKVKPIRRYRAGIHLKPEEQAVRGACMLAKTKDCDVLAFSRDIDGDSDYNKKRKRDIEKGIERAAEEFPSVKIIGGCTVPAIEGWVLAFSGVRGTETFSKDKAEAMLSEKDISSKDTQAMVEFVQQHSRTDVAKDAHCLNEWLTTAAEIL